MRDAIGDGEVFELFGDSLRLSNGSAIRLNKIRPSLPSLRPVEPPREESRTPARRSRLSAAIARRATPKCMVTQPREMSGNDEAPDRVVTIGASAKRWVAWFDLATF